MSSLAARIERVLVANRGEIACRVLRTLREQGIPSVAVYSDVDSDAPHVWLADEAVGIGEPRSYLDMQLILDAAKKSGSTAIHPGYGFLAENAGFARACGAAGLTFIGPSPESILTFGDKRAARELAEEAGVPVIPGAQTCDTVDQARQIAEALGLPVLLKAAAGGGGKGMRRVDDMAHIADAFASASREAKGAFDDDRLLVERYIHPARHVEVQVLGDGTDAVALGERECSLQRRYQKVLEESPSPGIDDGIRERLFESAVTLCRASGYSGAGTVEFLVGPEGEHYFLEVNTRLQVEHPVTELRFGIDLVACQLDIAHGGALPELSQPRGCAIEARLNAEDAYGGFLPATGEVLMLEWPQLPGVRIDSGIREGSEISPHYDSLVAKVIAWGSDREQARQRLKVALEETVLLGLVSNQSFLIDVLGRDFFISGDTFTTTLENEAFSAPEIPEIVREAASQVGAARRGSGAGAGSMDDRYSPWARLGGFRMGS